MKEVRKRHPAQKYKESKRFILPKVVTHSVSQFLVRSTLPLADGTLVTLRPI